MSSRISSRRFVVEKNPAWIRARALILNPHRRASSRWSRTLRLIAKWQSAFYAHRRCHVRWKCEIKISVEYARPIWHGSCNFTHGEAGSQCNRTIRNREINTAFSVGFPREPSIRSRMVFRGFKSTQLAHERRPG